MRNLKSVLMMSALSLVLLAPAARADEMHDKLTALVTSKLEAIASNASVIKAVEAQNTEHAAFDDAKISELDKEWQAEAGKGGGAMTAALLANPLSTYLKTIQNESGGLYQEVFVMDNKGLNVGASAMTSDYLQGDEAKFQKSFGANGPFIDEVKEDASTGAFVSQVSLPIHDPATKAAIGAITFSVDISKL